MLVAGSHTAFAQGDLGELLRGSQADAKYLAEGYISPFLRTYAAGINQGWYNTAKPHKIGGIDFTLSGALVTIPGSDRTFTIDNSSLNNIYLKNANNGGGAISPANGTGQVPTIFGKAPAPTYESKNAGVPMPGTEFNGPEGTDVFDEYLNGRVPVPVFNAGLGLPKGFELKVRWTPEIDFGDGQVKMIGFGVMHDIKQHIPGIKMLPFDLSALVAYSKMEIGVSLDENDATKRGEFTVQGTSVQAIISKKISVITPYAAIGFGTGTSTLKVKGDYDLDDNPTTDPTKDPVSVEEKVVSPRMTAGLRLKLLILTIHADYTLQKYSTLTVGLGLSVR